MGSGKAFTWEAERLILKEHFVWNASKRAKRNLTLFSVSVNTVPARQNAPNARGKNWNRSYQPSR
jgi:hypothetical protein